MKYKINIGSYGWSILIAAGFIGLASTLQAQERKPNIVFIMGHGVGWFNIGAYHRGIMSGNPVP
jgi:hypothetical protein